jgi:hypothetical protein
VHSHTLIRALKPNESIQPTAKSAARFARPTFGGS